MPWPTPIPTDPLIPTPGRTIADLVPAVLERQGVVEMRDRGASNLGLPEGERWVILLVDGLGRELLDRHAEDAPFLAGATELGGLTSCVPSTTAVSLTSLGTGVPPARHGIVGYTFWMPGVGSDGDVFHPLPWRPERPVDVVQPIRPMFEEHDGVQVSLADFVGTGLTSASLGRGDFVPVDELDGEGRIAAVTETAASHPLVYTYERRLDMAGHVHGCRSQTWLEVLQEIDAWVARLRAALPDGTRLIVTGDHGMVDVPGRNQLFVSEEPELADGVTRIFGEPRFVHVHTPDPDGVVSRWANVLGDHAWVRTFDAATADGWFGDPELVNGGPLSERAGDVVVAMRTDWAVLARPGLAMGELVGHHGSLTPAEMRIPLIVS